MQGGRMGKFSWLLLLPMVTSISGKDVLDLTGAQEKQGIWKSSVTLPCVYEPSPHFQEQSVIWRQPNHDARAIFRRDAGSSDQIPLMSYRQRLTVAKHPPGDVSLQIDRLEMTDSGSYTCEVTWVTQNKSQITKLRTTRLRVEKVAVTKPVIQLLSSHLGSILPSGTRANLTCLANGSPPIRYRWFKQVLGSDRQQAGNTAVLAFDRLQTSDTGSYYCEAENRISSVRIQQSDTVVLTVEESSTLWHSTEVTTHTVAGAEMTPTGWRFETRTTDGPFKLRRDPTVKYPVTTSSLAIQERISERQGPRKATLPLYLIILIAVLCAVLVAVVISVAFCRTKAKTDQTYEVAYNNNATNFTNGDVCPASPAGATGAPGCVYEEPTPRVDNNYTIEPAKGDDYVAMSLKTDSEYETLVNKMESEYETVDVMKWA